VDGGEGVDRVWGRETSVAARAEREEAEEVWWWGEREVGRKEGQEGENRGKGGG